MEYGSVWPRLCAATLSRFPLKALTHRLLALHTTLFQKKIPAYPFNKRVSATAFPSRDPSLSFRD